MSCFSGLRSDLSQMRDQFKREGTFNAIEALAIYATAKMVEDQDALNEFDSLANVVYTHYMELKNKEGLLVRNGYFHPQK